MCTTTSEAGTRRASGSCHVGKILDAIADDNFMVETTCKGHAVSASGKESFQAVRMSACRTWGLPDIPETTTLPGSCTSGA